MKEKNKVIKKWSTAMVLFVFAILYTSICVRADIRNVTVKDSDFQTITAYVGDTGKIIADPGTTEATYYEFDVDAKTVMTINLDGSYTIISPGSAYVDVYGYNQMHQPVFSATILFKTSIDMNRVTLKQSSVTGYLMPSYDSLGKARYSGTTVSIDINSPTAIPNSSGLKVKTSNKKIKVSAAVSNNKLNLAVSTSNTGKTTLQITIENKTFSVKLRIKKVAISNTSFLLDRRATKTLKISGYSGKIKWSSTNKNIATVSKKGKVTAKSYGSTVITAKIGNSYLGCAVSVTPSALIRVCERGEYMGANWSYSQALRTVDGYYDCSSLVWKAYTQFTDINFGSSSYPGTTRTESAWCRNNNRLLNGSFRYSMVSKMQLRPGDLVFKSTSAADPYNTTYHVEMLTGYRCISVNSKGKPTVVCRWAARSGGYEYGISDGYIVARPYPH